MIMRNNLQKKKLMTLVLNSKRKTPLKSLRYQKRIAEESASEPIPSTASGRLASLRSEIETDDKPVDKRPLSDRMADFFKD